MCLVNSEKAEGSGHWGGEEVEEREHEKGDRKGSYAEVWPSRKPVTS